MLHEYEFEDLGMNEQYKQFIGKQVKLLKKEEGRNFLMHGLLKSVDTKGVIISYKGKDRFLNWEMVLDIDPIGG